MRTWLIVAGIWLLVLGLGAYKAYRTGKRREERMAKVASDRLKEQYEKSRTPPNGES